MTTSLAMRKSIVSDIDAGRLVPGDCLDEQSLALRFEVSRTPAREALLHLAALGLVHMVPRRGAVVSGLSPDLGVGMVEALTALEAEAAGLAARRMLAPERADLAALHRASQAIVRRQDSEAYIVANAGFHAALYAGARNGFLAEQIELTRRRMRSYHHNSLHRPARVKASWQEHAAIVAAVAGGDEAAARDAMRGHILSGGTVFADMIANRSDAERQVR